MIKKLSKYFKRRKSAIGSLLEVPSKKYTSLTFHKLRVEIKKLKALMVLVNFCDRDFDRKKAFEPFKLIFKQAGKVRELQLEETMLKKYHGHYSLNAYRTAIQKQRLNEQDIYFTIVNRKLLSRLKNQYKKTVPYLGRVNNKKAFRYLEKKENSIQKLIGEGALQKKQVHLLRKKLKMLNYNLKSLPLGKQKTTLTDDVLPALLGRFHDYQVLNRQYIKTIADSRLNPEEIDQLEKVKGKIDSDSEIVFKKIAKIISSKQYMWNKIGSPGHRVKSD